MNFAKPLMRSRVRRVPRIVRNPPSSGTMKLLEMTRPEGRLDSAQHLSLATIRHPKPSLGEPCVTVIGQRIPTAVKIMYQNVANISAKSNTDVGAAQLGYQQPHLYKGRHFSGQHQAANASANRFSMMWVIEH